MNKTNIQTENEEYDDIELSEFEAIDYVDDSDIFEEEEPVEDEKEYDYTDAIMNGEIQ